MKFDQVIVIRSKTRLEQLIERFNSKAQAKFYIERSGGNFKMYETEHLKFYRSLEVLMSAVNQYEKHKVVDRSFLPTLLFGKSDLIIVIGQDGLVANTAKYVDGLPIVAFNPDPESYDGVLLPFEVDEATETLSSVYQGNFATSNITMAKAAFSDGQTLLAFNDFFIGAKSHVSARYIINYDKAEERQSSSGIIVSTGAGSTGWMSSIFNMVNGIAGYYDKSYDMHRQLQWEDEKLLFAVREPFLSVATSASLCFGELKKGDKLVVESLMANNGVVFSDGIEADAVQFNSGTTVKIGIADEKAKLVI